MSKIKVLYITGLGPLSGGGGNKRVFEILKRSKKFNIDYIPVLEKRNYPFALKSFPELKDVLKDVGGYAVELRPSDGSSLNLYTNIPKVSSKIAKVAKSEKVDLILSAHESFDLIHIVRLSSKLTSIPWSAILQLTPVVGALKYDAQGPLNAIKNSAASGNMLKIFIRYSKLVSIIKNLKETLSLAVSFSIPYELSFFSSGLNIKVLNPSVGVDEAIVNAKPLNVDFDAIYFARLHPLKGLFDIPFIWKRVTEDKPNAKLIMAGSWQSIKYMHEFYNLCKKLNLLSNIKYVGFLPKTTLYSYVKSAKLLIYPSYLDAFPLTVLESLACGTPVVAYNINSIRLSFRTDAVTKVRSGDRSKFAESVINILEDELLQKKLSKIATTFSSRYNWDSAAKEEFNSIRAILSYWTKS
ncbi:MAG: glycosyltransferase [Thermoproteota archaeon]|jgi:glycosyltransferase involved in cell wall biosynthesis